MLDAEEETGDVVEEIAVVEDTTGDAEAAIGTEVAGVEPVLSPVEGEAAASDVLTNGDVALGSGREAVLGIAIEEIDFEFEDE